MRTQSLALPCDETGFSVAHGADTPVSRVKTLRDPQGFIACDPFGQGMDRSVQREGRNKWP